jgi:hypothetical protein
MILKYTYTRTNAEHYELLYINPFCFRINEINNNNNKNISNMNNEEII